MPGDDTGQPAQSTFEKDGQNQGFWPRFLWHSAEGRVIWVGVILLLGFIGFLAWNALHAPKRFQWILAMTGTHLLFGRAAAMTYGYSATLNHTTVIVVNVAIETLMVFFLYPLFVLSWRNLLVFKALRKIVSRTIESAQVHQDTIRKYGILGLFVFVWSPFWMTGPVVGSAIGYLLGLRIWVNFSVVLTGTALATVCWSYFLRELHERVSAYGPIGPVVVLMIIAGIVISGMLIRRRRHRK